MYSLPLNHVTQSWNRSLRCHFPLLSRYSCKFQEPADVIWTGCAISPDEASITLILCPISQSFFLNQKENNRKSICPKACIFYFDIRRKNYLIDNCEPDDEHVGWFLWATNVSHKPLVTSYPIRGGALITLGGKRKKHGSRLRTVCLWKTSQRSWGTFWWWTVALTTFHLRFRSAAHAPNQAHVQMRRSRRQFPPSWEERCMLLWDPRPLLDYISAMGESRAVQTMTATTINTRSLYMFSSSLKTSTITTDFKNGMI